VNYFFFRNMAMATAATTAMIIAITAKIYTLKLFVCGGGYASSLDLLGNYEWCGCLFCVKMV